MNPQILKYLDSFQKNAEPELNELNVFFSNIDFNIDKEFFELYKIFNGAEGFLNQVNFLILWKISDIVALNPYYEDSIECENLFFFGTNGSNYGYAFDKNKSTIVGIDFLEIYDHQPILISNTFLEFLDELSK